MKWFGDGIYRVRESTAIAAGKPVPGDRMMRQSGEGVAIVLSGPAVEAWNCGGRHWKPWSSRVVSASLRVQQGRVGWLHVLSCYALTYAASREERSRFLDTLQQAISTIPSEECYVVLGDFNARVGSRMENDEWWNERGPHGYGVYSMMLAENFFVFSL